MTDEIFYIEDGAEVTAPAWVKPDNRYGTIADLPEDELADPDELERVAYKEMWWPILRLPQQRWECPIRTNMDEDGRVNWGAFGTVDFDSYRPQLDKLRYATFKLREKLKDMVFTLTQMSARIPGKTKFKILKLVRTGRLDIADIVDNEMYFLAEKYLQAWHLRERIERLQKKQRKQQEERLAKWLAE